MISAACTQRICLLIPRKITSCTFIARSTSRLGYSATLPPFWLGKTPILCRFSQSGLFTCYLHRSLHMLPTVGAGKIDSTTRRC